MPGGFFRGHFIKVSFLIDGFNVYHSVLECIDKGNIQSGKWFDYRKYCEWLVLNNPAFPKGSTVHRVRLYSAIANHKQIFDKAIVSRHSALNKALEHHGVEVKLGNFKEAKVRCKEPKCRKEFVKHEENKTDINVAMGVIESFLLDDVDCAVIVSGDTDQVATITEVRRFFPTKKIGVLLPAYRQNQELRQVSHFYIDIQPKHYENFPLPATVTLANGKTITKPTAW